MIKILPRISTERTPEYNSIFVMLLMQFYFQAIF